ncbi:hypothetical protein BDZ97DRAFT_1601663, partial [Flammula alnicola]
CAVCLGRHSHAIGECTATRTWNKAHQTLSKRENRQLWTYDGRQLCCEWQKHSGCRSSQHNERHICSGCGQATHGAANCPRAE